MKKTYTLYAGVNGAGKSTLYRVNDNSDDVVRINPDEIVQKIGHWLLILQQVFQQHHILLENCPQGKTGGQKSF